MFEIVQAPEKTISKGIRLFIAGGISNCPPWQTDLIERLKNEKRIKEELTIDNDIWEKSNGELPKTEEEIKIIVLNPRCKEVPNEREQIIWEYDALEISDLVSFWFSDGSINPITLFEYGKLLMSKKTLVVGCHEKYIRKNNVIIQTELENPKIKVNEGFEEFYNQLVETLIDKIINYRIKHINKLKLC